MKKFILKIALIALNLFWLTIQSFAQLNADFLRHKKLADDCFNKKDYECAIKQYTIANKVKRDDYCVQQIEKCEKNKLLEVEKNKLAEQKKRINSNELVATQKKGKWGFVDKAKKIIIPFMYEEAYSFSEELAAVKKNDKWGFVDKNNKLIIPFMYAEVGSFSEGMATVRDYRYSGSGYINKNNKLVIPYKYYVSDPFHNGLALVTDNSDYLFYIDKNGNFVKKYTGNRKPPLIM